MTINEPDVQIFHDMIVRVLERKVAPHYQDWEDAEGMPRSIWNTLGEAGLLGVDMPEAYGGASAGFEIAQLVVEEIARKGFGGLAGAYNIHANIVMPYILHYGTEAQKQRWLTRMTTGEVVGAIAMTEPGAGSDLAAMRTTAERVPAGWRINGAKVFITNGMLADLVIVCAKTDHTAGTKGVSLFLVDATLSGFSRGKSIRKIGMHAGDTAELFFSDLVVPEDALLGDEGRGFIYLMQELPRERLSVSAHAQGATEAVIDLALEYVQQRRAFGMRIADFQNTRFKLAEAKAKVEVGRAFLNHCIDKFRRAEMTSVDAAILKLHHSEMQCRVTDECLQFFGGYGYTVEYPISRFYVDARVQRIYAGTSEIMKEVIARSMLGKWVPPTLSHS